MGSRGRIEYIASKPSAYSINDSSMPGQGNSRIKLFMLVFFISLFLTLLVNFARPAVYSSYAVLLTTSSKAVDQQFQELDYQHVAIQKQKLLGGELLSETLHRVKAIAAKPELSQLKLLDIQRMLSVEEVEGTNLLNMRATGDNAELLPIIINTWIDVYLDARALGVALASTSTVQQIEAELLKLDVKIGQAREQLAAFRQQHNISSMSREENESPAILRGLTASFNQANENFLKAQSNMELVKQSLNRGEAVIPVKEEKALRQLENEYRLLKKKLTEFDKAYTRDYLKFKSEYKNLPEQIEKLAQQIEQKKSVGNSMIMYQSRQQYIAAKQVLNKIRQQLKEHKAKAAKFATLFSRHQQLKDDLEAMELLARKTRERRLKIEARQVNKYPQVDVVERATLNKQIISPNYNWGAAWALLVALGLAFFAVWFKSYLTMSDSFDNKSAADIVVNSIWPNRNANIALHEQHILPVAQQHTQQPGLNQISTYRKMRNQDIKLLLQHADSSTKAIILLLLSGLSLDEISHFNPENIDFEQESLNIAADSPRTIKIGPLLYQHLHTLIKQDSLLNQFSRLSITDLEATLYCLAVDCGLDYQTVNLAESLRQSYIIYLVEQGLRLSALEKVVGYLDATELAGYAVFSPAGVGCDIEQIQTVFPDCQ